MKNLFLVAMVGVFSLMSVLEVQAGRHHCRRGRCGGGCYYAQPCNNGCGAGGCGVANGGYANPGGAGGTTVQPLNGNTIPGEPQPVK
jgi:hypothetical protein